MTISGFSEKKILLYNDQWTIKIQTWSSPLCRQVWCQVCMKSGVISAPPHTLREYSTSSYIARIQHLLIHCENTAPPHTLRGYSSSHCKDTVSLLLYVLYCKDTILPLKDTEYIVLLIQGYRYNVSPSPRIHL